MWCYDQSPPSADELAIIQRRAVSTDRERPVLRFVDFPGNHLVNLANALLGLIFSAPLPGRTGDRARGRFRFLPSEATVDYYIREGGPHNQGAARVVGSRNWCFQKKFYRVTNFEAGRKNWDAPPLFAIRPEEEEKIDK